MVLIRGVMEILQSASGDTPKSFSDFTKIAIGGRRLSSATVSKRLGELISVDAIEEVITRSKRGRRIIGYKTTEKGKKAIRLAAELEDILAMPKRGTIGVSSVGRKV